MVRNVAFELPGPREEQRIERHFVRDLESFSVLDRGLNRLHPVVCTVCNSIPNFVQWHTFIKMKQAKEWFRKCSLLKVDIADEYPKMNGLSNFQNPLIAQYTTRYRELDDFILSPMTFVNDCGEILVCKECKGELEQISNRRQRTPLCMPQCAISNNRLVGDAPDCIMKLSKVSLSLISIA